MNYILHNVLPSPYIPGGFISLFIISVLMQAGIGDSDRPQTDDDFTSFRQEAINKSPVYEAAHRTGYGSNSIQPYYVCDNMTTGGAMPLNAWHYSCKQSCTDQQQKSSVNITRAQWNYIGSDIPTYKVSTNKVCYTAHENMWGYCTQSQTIEPVATTLDDKEKIPKEYFANGAGVKGVKTIVNSEHAECSYLSDNTKCARDYVVTYRPGKTSKKSENDPMVLNIYGDGIRVDPVAGRLLQNEVAWFWTPPKVQDKVDCGWSLHDIVTCKFVNTSEVLSCPDIGYQYNIKSLVSKKTCQGEIYDIDGPAPFVYLNAECMVNRTTLAREAMTGKGDPDINMIKGVNAALEAIEESYCSSSCDLFSRGHSYDDDHVLDTPIGTWRLSAAQTANPMLVPCSPTATWRIKSPTIMCHGKNHLLVEDSKTHHTCSWDTTRDYITVNDVCNRDGPSDGQDFNLLRKNMSQNQEIRIDFWTGDSVVMKPPYEHPIWVNHSVSFTQNPGWFSKVGLNKGMLHNKADLSHLLTTMASDMKQEIAYNKTNERTMKKLLLDEMVVGIGEIAGGVLNTLGSLLGGLPKLIVIAAILVGAVWVLKIILTSYLYQSMSKKNVTFTDSTILPDSAPDEELLTRFTGPSAPSRRTKSRNRQLSQALEAMDL